MTVHVVARDDPQVAAAIESVPGAAPLLVPDLEVLDQQIDDGLRADGVYALAAADPLLERTERLGARWVHVGGTGVDALPGGLLGGPVVTCGRGVSGIPIAEFVLASMLAFEKHFPEVWIDAQVERWAAARLGELAGKTLGVVGLGGIGLGVARRALAFDMEVLALRRRAEPSELSSVEVVGSLDELLPRADHLVLAAPVTTSTRQLLDATAFESVKHGVHLVNIARGGLVDQDALREALDDCRVGFASLDTVVPEPLPEGHWLYAHPRVHLSPHVSHSSPVARGRMVDAFAANLARFVAGEQLVGVVQPDEGY